MFKNLVFLPRTVQVGANPVTNGIQKVFAPMRAHLPKKMQPLVHDYRSYDSHWPIDAHLTLVQLCRTCLMAAALVGYAAALAPIGDVDPHVRLACISSATACASSTLFYSKLYALRRLPVYVGYSLEGNTVAETLRYFNWAICVALLTWCAYLLRGPFPKTARACMAPVNITEMDYLDYGHSVAGICWTYPRWRDVGPIISAAGTCGGLPGWHAVRSARVSIQQWRANPSRQHMVAAIVWAMLSCFFLGGGVFCSFTVGMPLLEPKPANRTDKEHWLSHFISLLWFVYPMISLLRTIALGLSGLVGDAPQTTDQEVAQMSDQSSAWYYAISKATIGATGLLIDGVISAVKNAYLAVVLSPSPNSAVAVSRLSSLSNGSTFEDIQQMRRETFPLLPQSNLCKNTRDSYALLPQSKHLIGNDDTLAVALSGDGKHIGSVFDDAQLNEPDTPLLHIPEVSPLCTQAFDSIIAMVDILSQAIATFACASLTLNAVM